MIALTAGHLTRDRIPSGFAPGGGVWYVAHAWRATGRGLDVRAVTAADPTHVPAHWPGALAIQAAPVTTTFHNTYGPEGRTMRLEAQAPPVDASRLAPDWRRCDVLLLAPVAGELDPAAWLAAVDAGISAAGLQGWLKQRVGDRFVPRPRGLDPGRLRGLDVAFLSDEDYGGDEAWLASLRDAVPRVVLTHGAEGYTVFEGGRGARASVEPVGEVDPTGAGDTFAAGTVAALAMRSGLAEAARVGARLAARCVGVRGPVSAPSG